MVAATEPAHRAQHRAGRLIGAVALQLLGIGLVAVGLSGLAWWLAVGWVGVWLMVIGTLIERDLFARPVDEEEG